MTDRRFKSLFITSLEFQKFIFIQEVLERAKDEGHEQIEEFLK